jgi:phage repressor protein C with HTH and peptisase S24 domain
LDEGMSPIDKTKTGDTPPSEVTDEIRITDGGPTEGARGHPAAFQVPVDLGEESFGAGHRKRPYRTIPINQEEKSYFAKNRNIPTNAAMDAVRKLILEKIDERGTNMAEVSRKIGRNHSYLQQFIYRTVHADVPEKIRHKLAAELGVDENDLRPPALKLPKSGTIKNNQSRPERIIAADENSRTLSGVKYNAPDITPGAELIGERDLPVFGTAQGGRGAVVLTNEAVDWVLRPDSLLRVKDGYGVIITGDSMSPEHKSGSTALVNPHIPRRSGDTCIFRNHADDGGVVMCIKELVRETDDLWFVKQHNPKKSFTLKKSEWQVAHVTVGNYFRR